MGSLTSASFCLFFARKNQNSNQNFSSFPRKTTRMKLFNPWQFVPSTSGRKSRWPDKVTALVTTKQKIKNKIITKHFWRVFSVEGKVDSLSAVHTHKQKIVHISLYIAYKGGSARLILFVLIPFSASALIRASGYYWMARAEEELVLFGALTHSNRFLSPPRTSPHHSREGGGKAKKGPRNEKCVYL
jgi:hypothetical protein